MGGLLGGLGDGKVALGGGCGIGGRGIEEELKGLEGLGGEIDMENGLV
ncbi:hypothetical protein [Staphylococcus auricularis]|nr:hypothetical protein [Staphylococcus auricularis]